LSSIRVEAAKVKSGARAQEFRQLEEKYSTLFLEKSEQMREYLQARHQHDDIQAGKKKTELLMLQHRYEGVRAEASFFLQRTIKNPTQAIQTTFS